MSILRVLPGIKYLLMLGLAKIKNEGKLLNIRGL